MRHDWCLLAQHIRQNVRQLMLYILKQQNKMFTKKILHKIVTKAMAIHDLLLSLDPPIYGAPSRNYFHHVIL